MATYTIVLVRHGESEWNALNKFTGWYDADLSELGMAEAKSAGQVCVCSLNLKLYCFPNVFKCCRYGQMEFHMVLLP